MPSHPSRWIFLFFPNVIDEQTLQDSPIGTIEHAIISILSATKLPHHDLRHIAENYFLIFVNNQFAIYSKSINQRLSTTSHGLHQAIEAALEENHFEYSFKLYQQLVLGEEIS